MTALLLIADVSGTGHPSDVTAGAVLTLVLPLALLAIVLTWWWLAARRGWPKLPVARRQAAVAPAPASPAHVPPVSTPPVAGPPAPPPPAHAPPTPGPQREPPHDGDA